MKKDAKSLYLVDGNSLCYRAFYAIRDLSNSKGMPTNAIYGFVNMFRKLVKEYDPDMLAVVFDMAGPTVRHDKYDLYKIQREPMPESLVQQMDHIKELVRAYNVPVAQLEGFEADDIIATIAEKAAGNGLDVVVVSSDKDALQLVDENIRVLSLHPSGNKTYRKKQVLEKYGVEPDSMADMMALMGDKSDNIPGVKGVGKVTAARLIKEYGTVEDLYRRIDTVSPESLRKKLIKAEDEALLSRELVELDRNVPFELPLEDTVRREPDNGKLAELYGRFEFTRLLKEVLPERSEEESTVRYGMAEDSVRIEQVFDDIRKSGRTAYVLDLEDDALRGICLCRRSGEADYIGLKKKGPRHMVEGLFADGDILKAGFDIKEDLRSGEVRGVLSTESCFDIMIADYLDEPSRTDHGLEKMALLRLNYDLAGEKPAGRDERGQGIMELDSGPDVERLCERCDLIFRLFERLEPALREKGLYPLFTDVEMPLTEVLSDMERKGVRIDLDRLEKISGALEKDLARITGQIHELAGEEFNINSPKQMQVILYEKLELPALKRTKTGISTDESVLRRLSEMHELPDKILEYRELNKLKTGYYDSIRNLVRGPGNKLHARFNQAVTATGRLSSSEPNLQNIPIKTPLGRKIRKAFVPASADKLLLAADYSQVELRVLAHLSGDVNLLEAFNEGKDVHVHTASRIFETVPGNVTSAMRSTAKTVNFGIVYGISAYGLSRDLRISVGEAQKFIDSYFERYTGVSGYIENTIEKARADGYVKTLLGRRRYIPELNSSNDHIRKFAERAAVNTTVQGSAADLIKLAMIACHEAFRRTRVDMIIQVHDELVFEVPEKQLSGAAARIKEIMETVRPLEVPLTVDMEAGPDWYDMSPVGEQSGTVRR